MDPLTVEEARTKKKKKALAIFPSLGVGEGEGSDWKEWGAESERGRVGGNVSSGCAPLKRASPRGLQCRYVKDRSPPGALSP